MRETGKVKNGRMHNLRRVKRFGKLKKARGKYLRGKARANVQDGDPAPFLAEVDAKDPGQCLFGCVSVFAA